MTIEGTHRTEIIADPDVPVARITREFDAPTEKVFRAHTDPELVVRWLGPRDITMVVDHWDCRTGGSYRYLHTREGEEYGFHGCFHEVRPSELIVQTFTFEGDEAVSRIHAEIQRTAGSWVIADDGLKPRQIGEIINVCRQPQASITMVPARTKSVRRPARCFTTSARANRRKQMNEAHNERRAQ